MKRVLLSVLLCPALLEACGSEEAAPTTLDRTPIVGTMELPISFRNEPNEPSNALRVEASPTELRLEWQPVYALQRGRIPSSEVGAEGANKLRDAMRAQPARSKVAITAHGMLPYGTLVRIVEAALSAGYRELALAVRTPVTGGATPGASWLSISSPQVAPAGSAPVEPATYGGTRSFRDFALHWEEVYQACRSAGAGHYIDCDAKPQAVAEDGVLQVVEWSRGNGMQLRFTRVGAPPPVAARAAPVELIEGVRAAPTPTAAPAPEPDTGGTFSFRADVASTENSAIGATTRPVCGTAACDVVIEGDEETATMRIVSFFGAAFPNGTPAPRVIFRLPR